MKRLLVQLVVAGALFGGGKPGSACGPWFPRQYLAEGGTALIEAPEFFAEIELKVLAREFPTPFKARPAKLPQRRNAEQDVEDFNAALADGSVRPRRATTAREAHRSMRNALLLLATLTEDQLGESYYYEDLNRREFPSEFADYHEGVVLYAYGRHDEAREAWKRLLARPAKERRYRSVNAAFMIGILGCVEDKDDAPKWLEMVRDLAAHGFPDSSGLAAASYTWEARWHEARKQPRPAAECILRAVASGYATVDIVEPANESELPAFAADPLLRRVHTALLLAKFTGGWGRDEERDAHFDPWLKAIEAAKIESFQGAERVAWMYYIRGDYDEAKRWLRHAPRQTAEALWLEGKLAARAGDRAGAVRAYARAARLFAAEKEPTLEIRHRLPDTETRASAFAGEQGIAALCGAEFQTALEAFLRGGHWVDAAYVAERVFTVEELAAFIRKRPWRAEWDALSLDELSVLATKAGASPGNLLLPPDELEDHGLLEERRDVPAIVRTKQLRWLLARRLARLERFSEARRYFPADERASLDGYARALRRGDDVKLSPEQRALALWDCALEMRYHGIELFGTETAPDWFVHAGDFEDDDAAEYRTAEQVKFDILNAGKKENARLEMSQVEPDVRYHYRYHAADLAWRATRLLPDNDQRLAEMLDLAGRWLAPRDPQAADRFYQDLEKRCAETDIGQRATEARWFVEIDEYTIPRRPRL